ncbi:dihydrouridine synthase [Thraustotheca clavata]|uniref:tRNA-dihydrouridine(16/17) synthase [NAD(P)(+)] n=1 Tax=Thraustotheca clavata TaxID=74557 RepID=A0A1V9ZPT4_9STRA|nr:dihydrouridine synthase [Thraustotheca clavata]
MNLFWSDIGCPKYVLSPMVDQSEYAFRQLCRRYGAELCYTPMLHAKVFVSETTYQSQHLDIMPDEGPTIVQFAGDDPKTLLEAAKLVENVAAAVDLNLGCPQPIARKGHYGSFLLRETDTIVNILQLWKQHLSIPTTCKIRIIDKGGVDPQSRGLQATLRLVDQLEAAGISALTVHGRNRTMNGKKTGKADWDAIAAIKQRLSIPVIANGNIECFDDISRCLQATGADAVMSSEAILENPALFSNQTVDPFQLVHEYLDLAQVSPFAGINFHRVEKAHVVRMLHAPMRQITHTTKSLDPTKLISQCQCISELLNAVVILQEAYKNVPITSKLRNDTWYRRHRVEEDRSIRKEIQRQWLAGGLRLTR